MFVLDGEKYNTVLRIALGKLSFEALIWDTCSNVVTNPNFENKFQRPFFKYACSRSCMRFVRLKVLSTKVVYSQNELVNREKKKLPFHVALVVQIIHDLKGTL